MEARAEALKEPEETGQLENVPDDDVDRLSTERFIEYALGSPRAAGEGVERATGTAD
jgi:hypothetical protein